MAGEKVLTSSKRYQDVCTREHDVKVDRVEFLEGYNEGLNVFCTRTSGREYGASGNEYAGICPVEKESDFLTGYNTGQLNHLSKQVTNLRTEVQRLKNDNNSKEAEIARLRSQINSLSR